MPQKQKPRTFPMIEDDDYRAPTKPGEMHKHVKLVRSWEDVRRADGRMTSEVEKDEGEVQHARNKARELLESKGMVPKGWDARDINLPNEPKSKLEQVMLKRKKRSSIPPARRSRRA
jgi:hypothetical protein